MATPEEIATALGLFYEQRIGPRFDSIEQRFDFIEQRFDSLGERFDRVDARFEHIDDRFGRVDGALTGIGERFGRVDEQFGRIDEQFGRIDEQFGRIDEQFGRIRDQMVRMGEDLRGEVSGAEARLRAENDGFRRDVDAHFDALYHRLDKLATEYQMIKVALLRLELAAKQDQQARHALQAEVAELRARVDALGERLTDLEARLSGP